MYSSGNRGRQSNFELKSAEVALIHARNRATREFWPWESLHFGQ
jgi:hypothetical protein